MSLINISTGFVTENAEGIICSATVECNDGKKATMLGTGSTLEAASQAAINNSKAQLAMLSGEKQSQTDYYPSQPHNNNQPINNTMENKSKFNGGGSKPASDKQKQIVENIANKQSQSGDQLCRNRFNKNLNEITGAEANQVMQSQKNSIEF